VRSKADKSQLNLFYGTEPKNKYGGPAYRRTKIFAARMSFANDVTMRIARRCACSFTAAARAASQTDEHGTALGLILDMSVLCVYKLLFLLNTAYRLVLEMLSSVLSDRFFTVFYSH